MKKLTVLGVLFVVGQAAAAWGQSNYYPYPYPYYDNRASTAAESYARGMADVVRSAGEANLRNSEAAKNYEDARSKYFDNRLKWTKTYFEMRKLNKMYRDEERKPPPKQEDIARWAAQGAPDRLSPSELDPLTGQLDWPILLRGDTFKNERDQLEAIFANRASRGYTDPAEYRQITEVTDKMLATLKKNIKDYPPNAYIESKRFLESLSHEARYASK